MGIGTFSKIRAHSLCCSSFPHAPRLAELARRPGLAGQEKRFYRIAPNQRSLPEHSSRRRRKLCSGRDLFAPAFCRYEAKCADTDAFCGEGRMCDDKGQGRGYEISALSFFSDDGCRRFLRRAARLASFLRGRRSAGQNTTWTRTMYRMVPPTMDSISFFFQRWRDTTAAPAMKAGAQPLTAVKLTLR